MTNGKRPSENLLASAHPFDTACTQVRKLEEAVVALMDGKPLATMSTNEHKLAMVMQSMNLIRIDNGSLVAVE